MGADRMSADAFVDAIRTGDARRARRLLASGQCDVHARVNEYSELPGLAAYGAVPQVTLLAYVVQSVVHGARGARGARDALRVMDALLNVNRRHGRYAGASLDATFMMMVEGLWEGRNHNDYTFKIREHAVPVTVEAYIRYLLLTHKGEEAAFLDAALNRILAARARAAADNLLDTLFTGTRGRLKPRAALYAALFD